MDNRHQRQIMYNLDKTYRKIQHSMRGNYIHSSLSKVYNLQFTCVFIILLLITVGAVWWLCFCILVMSCAFSHILVIYWRNCGRPYSKLLTRSREGALTIIRSYCNLEAGDTQSLKWTWRNKDSNPEPLAPQVNS